MSLLRRYENIQRYHIKYHSDNELNLDLAHSYIKEIDKIYRMIKQVYPDNNIVLTGYGVLLYYIVNLKYYDLIKKIQKPYILDFLIIEPSNDTFIKVPYIDDFQRLEDIPVKNSHFKNFWSNDIITEFNLSLVNNIDYIVKNIPLINLEKIEDPQQIELVREIISRIKSK